jgi:hypothetical protein
MKKGCFIKSIVILTIFVAAITYIIQYKSEEWIVTPGKKILTPVIEKAFLNDLQYVQESPEKDSLFKIVGSFIKEIDLLKENDSLKINFFNRINLIVADSIVTVSELDEFQKIFGVIK